MSFDMPSLSLQTYVKSPELKADLAMANALATMNSQSNTFKNSLTSLPGMFKERNGNVNSTIVLLRDTLENYLQRVFDRAVVDITQKEALNDPKPRVTLVIRVMVAEGEKSYNLQRLLQEADGQYKFLTSINNG